MNSGTMAIRSINDRPGICDPADKNTYAGIGHRFFFLELQEMQMGRRFAG